MLGMFDDNGDCLDPKLLDELTASVGKVSIEKPKSDYKVSFFQLNRFEDLPKRLIVPLTVIPQQTSTVECRRVSARPRNIQFSDGI